MDRDDLCFTSLHDLSGLIRRGEVTPLEVLDAHLARVEALNPKLLAFLTVCADRAREEAARAGEEIAAGRWRGPLHGIPYGAKDIIETAGVRTTYGSSFYREHVPAADARCIERLRQAGAILLGKCHTHEFAIAPTNVNPHYGPARNPWNTECITGGSSGGSGAALAAGLCPAAIGSDTGGSIRNPAAHCGVVGLKPTHGRVSLRGVYPNTPSLDHLGPMARSARDCAHFLRAMAGYDPLDPQSVEMPVPDYAAGIERGARGMRIALCPDFYGRAEVDREVEDALARAAKAIEGLGAEVAEAEAPFGNEEAMAVYRDVQGPQFAEVHRRDYDERPEGLGADLRARVEAARQVAPGDHVRAVYARVLLRRRAAAFFRAWDALLLPTLPFAGARIDTLKTTINGKEADGVWSHRPFLGIFSLLACPAIAVPTGFSAAGMPMSLQLVAGPWQEAKLLRLAHAYEAATPELRNRRPPC